MKTLKQKGEVIKEIAFKYKSNLSKLIKDGKNYENLKFGLKATSDAYSLENLPNNLDEQTKYLFLVKLTLDAIGEKEKEILNGDFFFPQKKKWWALQYSPAVYYKARAKAIDDFYILSKIWA